MKKRKAKRQKQLNPPNSRSKFVYSSRFHSIKIHTNMTAIQFGHNAPLPPEFPDWNGLKNTFTWLLVPKSSESAACTIISEICESFSANEETQFYFERLAPTPLKIENPKQHHNYDLELLENLMETIMKDKLSHKVIFLTQSLFGDPSKLEKNKSWIRAYNNIFMNARHFNTTIILQTQYAERLKNNYQPDITILFPGIDHHTLCKACHLFGTTTTTDKYMQVTSKSAGVLILDNSKEPMTTSTRPIVRVDPVSQKQKCEDLEKDDDEWPEDCFDPIQPKGKVDKHKKNHKIKISISIPQSLIDSVCALFKI
jgi:hypothetical protein